MSTSGTTDAEDVSGLALRIEGAAENNLHDVDATFGDGITAVVGASGSGKSSLVFDTLHREARHRFLATLAGSGGGAATRAAQVRAVHGLRPAVAVGQNVLNRNPLSTVATASGVHPFLRVLYARFATPRCLRCAATSEILSAEEQLSVLRRTADTAGSVEVGAPLVRGAEGSHARFLAHLAGRFGPDGLTVDDHPWDGGPLDPDRAHTIEVTLGVLTAGAPARSARALLDRAAALGAVQVRLTVPDGPARVLSRAAVCTSCGAPLPPVRPEDFRGEARTKGNGAADSAAAHPSGRKPPTTARRTTHIPEPAAPGPVSPAAVPEPAESGSVSRAAVPEPAAPGPVPPAAVPQPAASGPAPRVVAEPAESGSVSPAAVAEPAAPAPVSPAAAHELAGYTFADLLALDVDRAHAVLAGATLPGHADAAVRQILTRLQALRSLGLGYLALDRSSPSLSRGEAQRLRIAVLLANDVEDLLHILDEPTTGLGPDQVRTLMDQLARLAGPVVLVEHDRTAVAGADRVIEIGPGAGPGGGHVVYEGTPAGLWEGDTLSGRWFSGREQLTAPARSTTLATTTDPDAWLRVRGARHHNLTGFDCAFPVGALTVVTGPSGAGKSTLVRDVLVASLEAGEPRGCEALDGPALVPLTVDQSPIGVNPRSNPATYTGLADRIRAVLAAANGTDAGIFSFNRSEGACPECAGLGSVEVKLRFLPSEWVQCEACDGRRFTAEALALRAELADGRGYSVAEVFALSVREARPLFDHDAKARRILRALTDVGLDYLTLGQPSPTLSGGEAQRVKLARQLAASRPAQLVYLDEPSTGLHPADVPRLAALLRAMTDRGCTVVVVEHHQSIAAMADWTLRIGPGSGPAGGRLLHAGPPGPPPREETAPLARPRPRRPARTAIEISGATANNLRNVSVALPKNTLTAVVGVSGSGKSSLVRDVLEAEATRRLLESLSLYERQSAREGPRSGAASVTGLGPTLAVGAGGRTPGLRSTVGSTTDLGPHLGVLLAYAGTRTCPGCGGEQRRAGHRPGSLWTCTGCGLSGPPADPSDFSPLRYEAACLRCHGMGTVAVPVVERLITRPDRPLADGAMYSPGFYPRSYHSKPANGGYWMLKALGERYGFDLDTTPWQDMSQEARDAFLFGQEKVTLSDRARVTPGATVMWRGIFRIMDGWDVGGLYTERVSCPPCGGGRLRPEFLDRELAGMNRHALHREPVSTVRAALAALPLPAGVPGWAASSYALVLRRLEFLGRVGLGHLNLDRMANTLSAGELQRVRLTALLGADLTGMTVLLDEPSRGLHPRETDVLGDVLEELAERGNTVVLVDHDSRLVARAGHVVVMGPGSGREGGAVVAAGPTGEVVRDPAARGLLRRPLPGRVSGPRAEPTGWMTVRAPVENHFDGRDVAIPLGVLTGVCGVSGAGKSTLAIDIVARALAPKKLTTSAAATPVAPGAHARIEGAPRQVRHADQSSTGITSPGAFLKILTPLRAAYADTDAARERLLAADDLQPRCDACKGKGAVTEDMGFMPAVHRPCDACEATGYRAEVRELVVRGHSLPALERLTAQEVLEVWADLEPVAVVLRAAVALGLGHVSLGQTGVALSGGERQRLKLVREIAKPATRPTLYILDEPSAGLHDADVEQLVHALDGLVRRGHSVLLVDHDVRLLACCDRLLEIGPGGGPDGGRVVAEGTPEDLAAGSTATAPYLREVLS
ncbi:hypothetical protein [Streptomyces sp. NPDC005486]|uniref:hypothetical protein n=1 Tax=Streptomyces sp. NPDC005486 TaxID=3155345 RepID=UPI0033A447BD